MTRYRMCSYLQEMEHGAPSLVRVAFAPHYEAWAVTVRADVSAGSNTVDVFRVGQHKGVET
jgi:hypothetical protein